MKMKGGIAVEWVDRMNQVMDYIESHLCEEVDYDEISRISVCPGGIFQRVFMLTTGIPLSEYIRRRKLTNAAFEIQNTSSKIIDIALKYGYESSDAFCVAFKRVHGVTPTMARQPETKLKSYPRLSFTLSIKGAEEMNYRIVEREPFNVIGVSAHSSVEKDIWGRCKKDGTIGKLLEIGINSYTLGLCFGYDSEGNNTYMVGIESTLEQAEGMEKYVYPKSAWLVFEAIGSISSGTLGETWRRIYGEFLPQSTYKQAQIPTIEVYKEWNTDTDHCNCEIWIPVEK